MRASLDVISLRRLTSVTSLTVAVQQLKPPNVVSHFELETNTRQKRVRDFETFSDNASVFSMRLSDRTFWPTPGG
jgi:hypothetical protein